jgi:hypothetical protein
LVLEIKPAEEWIVDETSRSDGHCVLGGMGLHEQVGGAGFLRY